MDTLKLYANGLLGRETLLEIEVLGQPLRLVVTTRRELRRARQMWHERALIERMRETLDDGDVLFDVGANIGLVSLLMGLHTAGRGVSVHGFEPEPRNFEHFERNIEENGLGASVSAHRIALGAGEGEVELFVRGRAGEGRHSIAEERGSTASIRVPSRTAASFAAECGQSPTVVKIDVEGAEGRVLAGFEELMEDAPPRDVFLEIHSKGDRDRMPGGGTIADWLGERGFGLVWNSARRSGEHVHYQRG
ncbi:MAG: FkbM family methyltransferase [Planctomycetota bacterium]|jgi:FkbM family methyltransferase|nr:FkbM family methyltransferase [Planctomycetota bacterium]MDP6763565.1 FkbM family methyltransferase [Planctomycetota bacterium]MDP6988753.1 FkbM family methyltransferase [Planctomycetota bacterium]